MNFSRKTAINLSGTLINFYWKYSREFIKTYKTQATVQGFSIIIGYEGQISSRWDETYVVGNLQRKLLSECWGENGRTLIMFCSLSCNMLSNAFGFGRFISATYHFLMVTMHSALITLSICQSWTFRQRQTRLLLLNAMQTCWTSVSNKWLLSFIEISKSPNGTHCKHLLTQFHTLPCKCSFSNANRVGMRKKVVRCRCKKLIT